MFHLGCGELIKGWEEGCRDIKEGESRTLVVPPSLSWDGVPNTKAVSSALGPKSTGGRLRGVGVGGGATYLFKINCISVEGGHIQEERDKSAAANINLENRRKSTSTRSSTTNWNEKGEYVGPKIEEQFVIVEELEGKEEEAEAQEKTDAAAAEEPAAATDTAPAPAPAAAKEEEEEEEEEVPVPAPVPAAAAAAAGFADDDDDEVDYDDPMVTRASVVIQAGFRGMQARKEVEKMREDLYAAEEAQSGGADADKAPAAEANDLVLEDMEEGGTGGADEDDDDEIDFEDPMVQRASVTIQSGFRGMQARKEVQAMRAEKYSAEADPVAEEGPAEAAADGATTADAAAPAEAAADLPTGTAEEHEAATKIQAGFRGHQARKGLEKPAEGAPAAEAAAPAAAEGDAAEPAAAEGDAADLPTGTAEEHEAATKIQAGFRGHQARKGLEKPAEGAPAADEEPAAAAEGESGPAAEEPGKTELDEGASAAAGGDAAVPAGGDAAAPAAEGDAAAGGDAAAPAEAAEGDAAAPADAK